MTIGIIVLLLLLTFDGYRKGLIRKLVKIAAWILTLVLVSIAVPYIADFLRESTELHGFLQSRISGSDAQAFQALRIVGLEEAAAGFLADQLLQLLAFAVTFILVSVVIQGGAWALHIAAKLPLLHGANQILGAAAGFLEGMLVVWTGFLIAGAFGTSSFGAKVLGMIVESDFLTWIFVNNPLLHLFLG